MTTALCTKTPGVACVRIPNHSGVCTPCPYPATLGWDHDRHVIQAADVEAAVTLLLLDFETPHWADLNDG